MKYPEFFESIPRIKMHDPLAAFLGAVGDGVVEYSYLDVVKLAGHSCPTVASAYGMTRRALLALYGKDLPERGSIRVEFREDHQTGVTGVVANVVSMLTGATHDTGFKGLTGQFDRRNLLFFAADVPLEIRFTRLGRGAQVDVAANVQRVAGDPEVFGLMQRGLTGEASADELQRFGVLWQERVRRILLDHGNDPEVFPVHRVE